MSALVFEMFPEDCEIDSSSFKTPPHPQNNKKRRQFVAFKRKFGKGKMNAGCDQPQEEEPTTISDFNSVFSPHPESDDHQPNEDSKSCSIGGSSAFDKGYETRVIYDLTLDSPPSAQDGGSFFQEAQEVDETDENAGMLLKRSDSIETLVMTIADDTLEEDSLFYPVDEAKEDDNNEFIHITNEVETGKRVCRSRSPMFGSPNNTNKAVSYCSSPSY